MPNVIEHLGDRGRAQTLGQYGLSPAAPDVARARPPRQGLVSGDEPARRDARLAGTTVNLTVSTGHVPGDRAERRRPTTHRASARPQITARAARPGRSHGCPSGRDPDADFIVEPDPTPLTLNRPGSHGRLPAGCRPRATTDHAAPRSRTRGLGGPGIGAAIGARVPHARRRGPDQGRAPARADTRRPTKFARTRGPSAVRTLSGWNWTPSTAQRAVPHAHHDVVGPRGDLEDVGERGSVGDQASGSGRRRRGRARRRRARCATWRTSLGLPCTISGAATIVAAERLADRLVPEAHARGSGRTLRARRRPAASPRRPRGGRGRARARSRRVRAAATPVDVDRVVAVHDERRSRARRAPGRGCR